MRPDVRAASLEAPAAQEKHAALFCIYVLFLWFLLFAGCVNLALTRVFRTQTNVFCWDLTCARNFALAQINQTKFRAQHLNKKYIVLCVDVELWPTDKKRRHIAYDF